jgi:hypothetical protein
LLRKIFDFKKSANYFLPDGLPNDDESASTCWRWARIASRAASESRCSTAARILL